jgi:DMSO/TMAO reductase YedYZ molybdopterin-dependent catalytic subunit
LLAKLWVVYPHLWSWPPLRTVAHAVERISLFPLIAGALFLLVSGTLNVANWYPWAFFFPTAHYWASWITIGALVVHIAAKLPITRDALTRTREHALATGNELSRRGFLVTVASAVGAVTLATVGETLAPLRRLSVLAARDPAVGPQGLPVNKSASSARVLDVARDPAYRLRVEGNVRTPLELSVDDLRAMPQSEARLPIACVEGWSANASWRGIPVRDLLARAGAHDNATVTVESLQPKGLYRRSELSAKHASDAETLLALEVNGEPLHIDHGYPLRLIGPNRPGVMQTKWVSKLIVH